MNGALEAFRAGAVALREYVVGLQLEWRLLAAGSSEPPCSDADAAAAALRLHVGSGVGKRRFDYNSVIISLYGLIEQFVEALVRDYALQLHSLCREYAELPEAFQKAHTELSVTLLTRLDHSRYRGVLTARTVTANLHSCLNGNSPFTLNLEALYLHSANFRSEVVAATLSRLGIQSTLTRLRHCPAMSSHLAQVFPDRELATVTDEEIYQPINDLAERRNEVAHGSASSILSNEILLAYLQSTEAFCAGLSELLTSDALAFEVGRRGSPLGKPIAVYNNSIVCLELSDIALSVGDTLVAETGQSSLPFIGGPIVEIQIEGTSVERVEPVPSVKVGCKVRFKAKDTQVFYLLPVVAGPAEAAFIPAPSSPFDLTADAAEHDTDGGEAVTDQFGSNGVAEAG